MSTIGFAADFFDTLGGAEQNDTVLFSHLSKKVNITKIQSTECTLETINQFDKLLIGNFALLPEKVKDYISQNKKYIIDEHDHQYVSTRDPSVFVGFDIPSDHIINKQFYKNSYAIVCLGIKQLELISKYLSVEKDKIYSISGSLWSSERLSYISSLLEKQSKRGVFGIVNSSNPIKNTRMAVQYCKRNNINYELFSNNDPNRFLSALSEYEGLVFFPGVLESMCRLIVEAKMLNCKIITTPKKIGAYYEDWITLSGQELIDKVGENVDSALKMFEDLLIS